MGLDFDKKIGFEICKIKQKSDYEATPGIINVYEIMQDKEEKPLLSIIKEYKAEDVIYDEQCGVRFMNKKICLQDFANEHIYIMAMDSRWKILGIYNVSIGSWNYSTLYKSSVLKFLVLTGAKAFSIYHNHPNGLMEASDEDIETAFGMYGIGKMLDIEFSGSYIIGRGEYCKIII